MARHCIPWLLSLCSLASLGFAAPALNAGGRAPFASADKSIVRRQGGQSASVNGSCTNGPNSRACWGGGYDINTDYYSDWPSTGQTRQYTLEITNTTMAPDGTERLVFAINGQYPGPVVEADWGDTLEITVKNSLQNNGTSIHWHGLQQVGSNNMDGVNGVTECPLAPEDSRTYSFVANQYGTSWYHSHFSAQYGDGVQGPIVIHGPASVDYDIDLGVLPITDWYYLTATQIDYRMSGYDVPPLTADNGLINGTMKSADGTAGAYATTQLQPGKTHRLRLINTGVDNHFMVHLDNHQMTIISADFVPIEPLTVDWLFIGIGERYDVLITANASADTNYWFRAEVQTDCGTNANNGNIKSIFSYANANASSVSNPTSTATNYTPGCLDQTGLVPILQKSVPSTEFQAQASSLPVLLSYGTLPSWSANHTQTVVQWSIDSHLFTIARGTPTLSQVFAGESNWTSSQNLIALPHANEFTFWIIQALAGDVGTAPHPMHLHGHDFFVLGAGTGNFSDAGALQYENPTRRDVAMLPENGWLVIAFVTNNPGAWLFHCHIAWHASEGLAVQFLERAGDIPDTFQLGSEFERGCKNWDDYNQGAVYQQFESGI